MSIKGLHPFHAHQRTDEHEQGRFGQVEIGHQPVNCSEAVSRSDKDRGVAFERTDNVVVARRAFEQAHARGAHGNYPVSRSACCVEPVCGGGIDPAPFGVHRMVSRVISLHRQERPRSDMQCEHFANDPGLVQRGEQFRGKMERRCRGGNRSVLTRKDGLIV